MQPIIGITLDSEKGGYADTPWYAIRENYCSIFSEIGAIPVLLPHEPDCVDKYLEMIDGVVITGGHFDISPTMYGDKTQHETVKTKDRRTDFEFLISKKAIEQKKPILGICGGEQLLNVILGGTLIQHIPDEVVNSVEHEQKSRTQEAHKVSILKETQLSEIVKTNEIGVNTTHHQAVKEVGEGVVVNAVAPDGIIEGIEYPAHPFCIGIQWHPEYKASEADENLIKAFIKACKKTI